MDRQEVTKFFKEIERQLEDIFRYGRDEVLPFDSLTKEQTRWFKESAPKGNSLAQTAMGWRYYNKKNKADALRLLEEASDSGYSPAQYLQGEIYMLEINDDNSERFTKIAKDLFQKSADQNCASAQYRLATIYFREGNVEKSKELLHKSADYGNMAAKNFLGQCHLQGINGCEYSYQMGVEYFRQAAELGSPIAMNNLGLCYFQGLGVEESRVQSAKWFMEAAERNHTMAQNNLGSFRFFILISKEHLFEVDSSLKDRITKAPSCQI